LTTIICPWCGTNYTRFQSNCRNCGGTLPAPSEVAEEPAKPRRAAKLEMPAPPPREISENYVWRLMMQDGWLVSAGVFVLIGGIFTVTGGGLTLGIITAFVGIPFIGLGLLFLFGGLAVAYWRYQIATKAVNVLRHGRAIEGEITGLDENVNVRINGRTPWTIYYKFGLDGQDYEGKVSTLNTPWATQPGQPAVVLYLPDAPENNQLYPHP
jgi:hypothetical protein